MNSIENIEHLVAAAGMGFVVKIAEENDHRVVGRAIEKQILESVPKAAVIDQFPMSGALLDYNPQIKLYLFLKSNCSCLAAR